MKGPQELFVSDMSRKEATGKVEKLNTIKNMLESSLSPKKASHTNAAHASTTSQTTNLSGLGTNLSSISKVFTSLQGAKK